MNKQEQDDIRFLNIAKILSTASKCVSLKVGAVIVKDGRILSTGVNGTPNGHENCCDKFLERGHAHTTWSEKHEIHAEMNAILFSAKNGTKIDGATIYTLIQPCWQCTKNLTQSGIKRIVFAEKYYRTSSEDENEIKEYLQRSVIELCQITLPEQYSGNS